MVFKIFSASDLILNVYHKVACFWKVFHAFGRGSLLLLLLLLLSSSYFCMPETRHVSVVRSVADILLLTLMTHLMLFPMIDGM